MRGSRAERADSQSATAGLVKACVAMCEATAALKTGCRVCEGVEYERVRG